MVRLTSDLKHKYGYAEIIPGGIPVDIDAAARAQHEAAMGSAEPQPPSLVQILPVQTAAPAWEPNSVPKEAQAPDEIPPSDNPPQPPSD
jgi:hypothetical protein